MKTKVEKAFYWAELKEVFVNLSEPDLVRGLKDGDTVKYDREIHEALNDDEEQRLIKALEQLVHSRLFL